MRYGSDVEKCQTHLKVRLDESARAQIHQRAQVNPAQRKTAHALVVCPWGLLRRRERLADGRGCCVGLDVAFLDQPVQEVSGDDRALRVRRDENGISAAGHAVNKVARKPINTY